MSVGSAELYKSIRNAWIDWGIDAVFRSYWSSVDQPLYPSLHDTEATPAQPFPYCTFFLVESTDVTRMSGHTDQKKRIVKDIPVVFHIHAKTAGTKSAKEVAAELLEVVLSRFGGHPTDKYAASWPDMDHSCILLSQYRTDYGMRTGDEEYQWVVDYEFKVDSPIRI